MHSRDSDIYLILADRNEAATKEKGSKFIARAIPVKTVEQASVELALLRKKEYDATHHCSAYRIGPEGALSKASDDGEPSGTAGAPILRQIDAKELTDTLVVVTRYYGGTKLGTGGLIRAYGEATALVLQSAKTTRITKRTRVRISFDYADTSPAMHTIQQYDTEIGDTQYGDRTVMEILVKKTDAAVFSKAFTQALAGRGDVENA